ncbi:MAG TPA: helix-turn-helix transcriptional regulator [Fibrobacteria bacterium]|nr:helix-turn-helix transcriptional regulator [Fibrobacteria bacterium]HOX51264.1 helix-turn-helix transcriptional regulator [Fibrobacteria bacterium]
MSIFSNHGCSATLLPVSKKSSVELEDQRRLGRQIRAIRDRLKLTRNDVADVLGTSELMVQRLENGTAILTVPRMLKLAEAFGVDPAELLLDLSSWEVREGAIHLRDLSDEERRLLAAWNKIEDRVQRRTVLELVERMVR